MKPFFTVIFVLFSCTLAFADKKNDLSGRIVITLRGEGLKANRADDVLISKDQWFLKAGMPEKGPVQKKGKKELIQGQPVALKSLLNDYVNDMGKVKNVRVYFAAVTGTLKDGAVAQENGETFVVLDVKTLKEKSLSWDFQQQYLTMPVKAGGGKKATLMNVYKITVENELATKVASA
ncbi:MAG: hypothetical protein CMM87_04265 [Rickettsiales bacterium]|nr:hypothetical protein [Rickettsiales bacterium]|tara:strand:+ start:1719 stop:2252 length:534 start_codon:yes stop_codon:yes gene_type:complete